MPFSPTNTKNLNVYQGPGNWGGLPEFNLTERFGGKTSSSDQARRSLGEYGYSPVPSSMKNTARPGFTPYIRTGSVKGVDTTSPTNTNNDGGGSGGGGGGSDNYDEGVDPRLQEVDDIYSDIMNYISKQRKNLNASKSSLLSIAQRPYEAMKPKVQASADTAVGTLRGYQSDVGMEGENALDSARRLHNELNTRNQQVFGSSELSSAGQASGELLARDSYKQFGDIRQQVSTQIRTLENEIGRVQRERDVQLNELESQKQQALAQAELSFRDKISQLDMYESETRRSKKVDKINTLKEYRAEVKDTNRYFREMQSQVATNSAFNEQQLSAEYENLINSMNSTTVQAGQGVDAMGNELTAGNNQMAYDQSLGVDPSVQSPLLTGYRKPLEEEQYNPMSQYAV